MFSYLLLLSPRAIMGMGPGLAPLNSQKILPGDGPCGIWIALA